MSIQKNQEYIVDIIDNGFEGEGIAKIDNFTIFIPGTIKGEKVRVLIVKVLSSHGFGKIVEIIEKSQARQDVDCNTYKRCGGCNLRHVKYEETLKMKQNAVQSLVNKTLKNKLQIKETVGMENPLHYRNKAQYPIGINKKGEPVIGVFANRTHEVIPIDNCLIQNKKSEEIAKFIIEFIKEKNISIYDEKKGKGLVRHIVTKVGIKTGEIMCVIVINGHKIPNENELVENLKTRYPEIKAIVKNINMKNTNVILGQENINLYGNGYIEDILGEYKFKISPLSFYQVNPVQAEKLYNLGVSMAEITKNDVVFDLYCGIGTIGIFASKYAKKVYGIEIVEQAIEDAKENANINEISNIEFYAGKVEKLLPELLKENKADVVFIDPPRKGLDENTIKVLLELESRKIIYISCNPATLARDLSMLTQKYKIKEIQPIDMFPFTSHVECVCLLQLC